MNLTKTQLEEIEKFSGLLYSIKDIAVILELDADKLHSEFQDKKSNVYRRYMKGFLTTDSQIRMNEISLAKRGSTPAQESVKKYVNEARIGNK